MSIQLKFRPACIFSCIFLLSLYFGSLFYSNIKIVIAGAILIGFAISAFCHFVFFKQSSIARKAFITFIFLLALCFSLIISYFSFDIGYHRNTQQLSGKQDLELIITQRDYSSPNSSRFKVIIVMCGGKPCRIGAELETSFECEYQISDKISASAVVTPSADGYSLSDKYDLSKGTYCYIRCDKQESVKLISRQYIFPDSIVSYLRSYLSSTLEKYFDGHSLAVLKAVIYGDKSELDYSTTEVFSNLGVSHTLAISGLHMGIIIAFATSCLKLLKVRKSLRSVLILLIGFVYILMAGLAPSVCRTYIMFAVMIVADFSRRKRDPATSLLIAVMIICILSPQAIFDVGLHLSFFSTLGILTFALPITESINKLALIRPMKWVTSLCVITVCANLFTLPYSIFFFKSISLISPVSNLIIIPLITVIVYLAPFVVVFSFAPIIAQIISYGITAICQLIRFIIIGCHGISHIFILSLDSVFSHLTGAIVCTIIGILLLKSSSRIKIFALVCAYLLAVLISICFI